MREENLRLTLETYIRPLVPRMSGAHRELRAALAVAQLGGLLSMYYQQQDPHLLGADRDELIDLYGDAIQRLLTP